MLKGIPSIIPPELLKILCEMGHGDEIVIADGNFPSASNGKRVIRMDGTGGEDTLSAVLSLIPLDTYADKNMILMNLSGGDTEIPPIWGKYEKIANSLDSNVRMAGIDRADFYERARNAYAIIATGESAIYANIILKKGVI